jgi:nucleotide-binding universal stress UspA family protein
MTKIVVGYTLSERGEAALEAGIAEARLRDAELLVMHSSRGGEAERDEDVAAYAAAGDRIEQRLSSEGLRFRLGEHVLGNSPAEDIVALARSENAHLIVIGLRRRTLVGKVILGSVAQDVLMKAPCPVLVVRPSASKSMSEESRT